eukprot:Hpha_TRINITY_DN16667_c0_g2::TRINITY_DN16667_c0_g2_i1::g.178819::m.178819
MSALQMNFAANPAYFEASKFQPPAYNMADAAAYKSMMTAAQESHNASYRHEPYSASPTMEGPPPVVPEAPLCGPDVRVTHEQQYSTPYEYAQYAIPLPTMPTYGQQAPAWFALPTAYPIEPIPSQAFPQAWCIPVAMPQPPQNSVKMAQVVKPVAPLEPAAPMVAPPSLFDGCTTKRERRALAELVITKGLQQGKNKTYGASRRKMTKW